MALKIFIKRCEYISNGSNGWGHWKIEAEPYNGQQYKRKKVWEYDPQLVEEINNFPHHEFWKAEFYLKNNFEIPSEQVILNNLFATSDFTFKIPKEYGDISEYKKFSAKEAEDYFNWKQEILKQ